MIKRTPRHGTPLDPTVKESLRALVEQVGEYEAAKIVGIGYPSIARAMAGLGLRSGTVVAITMRLEALKTSSPARAAAKK